MSAKLKYPDLSQTALSYIDYFPYRKFMVVSILVIGNWAVIRQLQ